MALYCAGDIQGCGDAFERLLSVIGFSPSRDTIYLLGDLVNRGPASAAVLRRCMQMGDSVRALLGNHDLHLLAVADREASLIITGNGDVLEPEQGIVAIGSGGAYAQSAAKALLDHTTLSAAEVVKKSLEIAGSLCVYTNMNHVVETL